MFDSYRKDRIRLAHDIKSKSNALSESDVVEMNTRLRLSSHYNTLGADIALKQFPAAPSNAEYLNLMAMKRSMASRSPMIGREDLLGMALGARDDGVVLLREMDGVLDGEEIVYEKDGIVLREDLQFRKLFASRLPGMEFRSIHAETDGSLWLNPNLTLEVMRVSDRGDVLWQLDREAMEEPLSMDDFFSSFAKAGADIFALAVKGSKVVRITLDGHVGDVYDLSPYGIGFVGYDKEADMFICVNERDARIVVMDAHFHVKTEWAVPRGPWRPVQIRRVGDRFLTCWGRGGWQSRVQWYSLDGEPQEVVFEQKHAPVHGGKCAVLEDGRAVVFDHFGTITGIGVAGNVEWRLGLSGKQCRIHYGAAFGSSFIFSDLGQLRKIRLESGT